MQRARQSAQGGVSLLIVLVMVLLSALLVLWASRTTLLNEMLTGNDSDYQRAFEAAQAMVRDAEFDIMGKKPDGSICKTDAAFIGCRSASSGGAVFFPQGMDDFTLLSDTLLTATTHCSKGICVDAALDSATWTDTSKLAAMTAAGVAATYGEYTGALKGADSNPLLASAWYWVEVLPYAIGSAAAGSGGAAAAWAPSSAAPFVYRITAIAQGRRAGTRAVVQSVFSMKPAE